MHFPEEQKLLLWVLHNLVWTESHFLSSPRPGSSEASSVTSWKSLTPNWGSEAGSRNEGPEEGGGGRALSSPANPVWEEVPCYDRG